MKYSSINTLVKSAKPMDVNQQYLISHHVFVLKFQAKLVKVDNVYEDILIVYWQLMEVVEELNQLKNILYIDVNTKKMMSVTNFQNVWEIEQENNVEESKMNIFRILQGKV